MGPRAASLCGLGSRLETPDVLPGRPAWIGCAGAVITPSESSGTHDDDSLGISTLGTGDTVGVDTPGVWVAINSCRDSVALRPLPIRGESDFSGLPLDSCPGPEQVSGASVRLLLWVSCAWSLGAALFAAHAGVDSLGSLPFILYDRVSRPYCERAHSDDGYLLVAQARSARAGRSLETHANQNMLVRGGGPSRFGHAHVAPPRGYPSTQNYTTSRAK